MVQSARRLSQPSVALSVRNIYTCVPRASLIFFTTLHCDCFSYLFTSFFATLAFRKAYKSSQLSQQNFTMAKPQASRQPKQPKQAQQPKQPKHTKHTKHTKQAKQSKKDKMISQTFESSQWGPWTAGQGSFYWRARPIAIQDVPSVPVGDRYRAVQLEDGAYLLYEYAGVNAVLDAYTAQLSSVPQILESPPTSDPAAPQEAAKEEQEQDAKHLQVPEAAVADDEDDANSGYTSGGSHHSGRRIVRVERSGGGKIDVSFPFVPEGGVVVIDNTRHRKSRSERKSSDGSRSDRVEKWLREEHVYGDHYGRRYARR